MSTFVLVHGAWHGGWCWERVEPLLSDQGHEVITPTLTGLGERADELTPEVGLHTHVGDVVGELERAGEPAILVGHSYAGLVVREAANQVPECVRELVLLEAWIGPPGSSLFSLAPDWFVAGIRQAADHGGEGWRVPPPPPAVVGVLDPDDAAWLERRVTDHPLRSFADATELSEAGRVPARAILAPDGPVPFAKLAAELELPTLRLAGGHDLMITSPGPLAGALLETA